MNVLPALIVVAAAQLWSNAAVSDTPVVKGHTTATAESVPGILRLLGVIAPCPNEQSFSVEDMPAEFDPKAVPAIPSTLGPAPIEPVRYEYWAVAGCGRHLKVLIQLWYDKSGIERFGAIGPKG